jgi:biotin carboxyl carrier protein
MPGQVLSVDVAVGDRVKHGQRLMIVEAMKMEHAISAPYAGVVGALLVAPGDRVAAGVPLADVIPDVSEASERKSAP